MKNLNKYIEPGNVNSIDRIPHRPLVLLMLCGTLLAALLLSSCKEQKSEAVATANKDIYYTCSMHPQVHEDRPGNCPVCGMKLIAVSKKSIRAETAVQIQLSAEQIRLGNIHADSIRRGRIGDKMILAGTLNFDQDKLSSVSARVEGRVDKLYFKNIGDYVEKGTKLYELYSEQLNSAKQEYVNALQQEDSIGNSLIDYGAFIESAKTKLLLWGMTKAQINELATSKQVASHTSFYSREAGYITTLNVNEGEYVVEGGTILQLANLSTLWAEAQVYTTQMSSISKNGNVTVQIPDINQTVSGTIDFVNPEINPDTRINLVRVTIFNKNNQLHPGMPVYITINNKQHCSIILPVDAVLRDSKGATVWVQAKPGVYEIRTVKTGIVNNDAIEIISGLTAGDVVVTSGTYLLNSEYIFKHGADPMEGMEM